MKCNGCGQTDHVGGCDLVEFYFYQRYGRAADRTPSPPTPLIASSTTGVDEAPPLSPPLTISSVMLPTGGSVAIRPPIILSRGEQLDERIAAAKETLALVEGKLPKKKPGWPKGVPRGDTLKTTGNAKKVDSPEIVAKREEIMAREKKEKRAAYLRQYRKLV